MLFCFLLLEELVAEWLIGVVVVVATYTQERLCVDTVARIIIIVLIAKSEEEGVEEESSRIFLLSVIGSTFKAVKRVLI